MSQLELRDAYLLANREAIEAERDDVQSKAKGKEAVVTEETSGGETSDGEGSQYDSHDYDEEIKQTKRKRKTTYYPGKQRPKSYKRATKIRESQLSGMILPQNGETTVAGEAFSKSDDAQKKQVTEKVNKKTKQVQPLCCTLMFSASSLRLFFTIRSQNNL